jgi:hypothetical protein
VRGTSNAAAVRATMSSRVGGGGAICCRPDPDAVFGERWATLATVELDVAGASLVVRRGGPTEPVVYASGAPAGAASLAR